MIYLFCGVVIGVVMGLTGAGGALVAIPLFMHFLHMSLKEASVYSLVAVVIASLLNYLTQRHSTQYRTAFVIITGSAVGSYLTAPFKEALPSVSVAILLALVSSYALYSVWRPVTLKTEETNKIRESFGLSLGLGVLLGALTTFTGLGGGVLMLPLFLALYRYSQSQAVATGLLAVGLSSLVSLLLQAMRGSNFEVKVELLFLVAGILGSVYLLRQFAEHLPEQVLHRVRQFVFTGVVILAMLKLFGVLD